MDYFAGARARLDRAREQTDVLHDEFLEFSARAPHAVREIFDAETWRKRAVYAVTEEFPAAWTAIIGEIAYDLRSALDHVVYDLTDIESGGPLGHTGFPIFEDEARYDEVTTRGEPALGSGVFKIRGVNSYAKAAIRSLQPFEMRKTMPFEEPMLTILQELYAADRHRTVPLCRLRWAGSTMRTRRPVRDLVFLWGATLDDGATLAEWTPTAGADGEPDLDVNLDFDVAFGDGAPTRAYGLHPPVIDVLEGIARTVGETIRILEATATLIGVGPAGEVSL
jgi:hypothetical protein